MIFSNATKSGFNKALILFFVLCMLASPAAFAHPKKHSIIKQKLHTVAVVEQQRKNAHKKVVQLKWLENLEKGKLYQNQQNLEKTQNDLNTTQSQLHQTQQKLESTRDNLSSAIVDYRRSEALASKRIKQIFKTERVGLIHLLLSANNVNTLLDRIYYEKIVTRRDKMVLENMRRNARKIAHIKRQIENEQYSISQSLQTINTKKTEIAHSIDQNQSMIHKLKTNRDYYEKSERELAQQSDSIRNMINRMIMQQIAESRRQQSMRRGHSRGGRKVKDNYYNYANLVTVSGFIRPVGGTITSPFGWRVHPLFHSRIFHSGVDIATAYGTPIHAANSGVVMYTGWYGGYGKVVIINHGTYGGKQTSTLYAHMSGTAASAGQRVGKGQVIGYVGSTGYSTGPHCHFEVRIQGQPTNPLAYIR